MGTQGQERVGMIGGSLPGHFFVCRASWVRECTFLLAAFMDLAHELGVPLVKDKTGGLAQ